MKKQLRYFMTLLLMMVVSVGWSQTGVKWVETAPEQLKTGDVVVIVDKHSLKAMKNDGGHEADAKATSIIFNKDTSEIAGKVDATLQWIVIVNDGSYQFKVPHLVDYLYCTTKNVLVGDNSNNKFSILKKSSNNQINNYLFNTGKNKYIGVNYDKWSCYDKYNNTVKATVTAFYKMVEEQYGKEYILANGSYPVWWDLVVK